jgi:hypothetical integral membrane protein (TIGR02206 family)
MSRSRWIIVAAGFAVILGAQAVFTIVLATPEGVRIHSPQQGLLQDRSLVVAGDAWARRGVASVRVEAIPADQRATGILSFPAARDAVTARGVTLFRLSSWSARVTLPGDGRWTLRAVSVDTAGRETATPPRELGVRAGAPTLQFRSWTPEHLVPIAIIVLVSVGLGLFARPGGERVREAGTGTGSRRLAVLGIVLTLAVWCNETAYQFYWFFTGGWSVSSALMLQMCGLSILFLPVMYFARKDTTRQWLFDILYFWGIGGALQALIAPDIGANGFPAYRYFSFFISHGLIIAMTVAMAIAGRVRITVRSLLRALVVTNVLLIPMYGIDRLIALLPPYDPGNYFILGYPPPTGSIVDLFVRVFGPFPWYVIGLEVMGIVVFLVLYAPWPLARLLGRRPGTTRPASPAGA